MDTRIFVIATVLAACGGSNTPTNPGQSPRCSVTLSGAVTGTFDCKPTTTGWVSATNNGNFGFGVSAVSLNVGIGWLGQPGTGVHYKPTDLGAQGGVSLQQGSGASAQLWSAGSTHGSYDLYFSRLSTIETTSLANGYSADGTFDATLDPLSGQSGSVMLHATFSG